MLKTRTWILIFIFFLLGSSAVAAFLYFEEPEAVMVEILQDGKCIKEIDLSTVDEPYSFIVEDTKNGGSNTIRVEPGRICISEADCPDQICVHHDWLPDNPAPIVCLPHRLVIQLKDDPGETDTLAQ